MEGQEKESGDTSVGVMGKEGDPVAGWRAVRQCSRSRRKWLQKPGDGDGGGVGK